MDLKVATAVVPSVVQAEREGCTAAKVIKDTAYHLRPPTTSTPHLLPTLALSDPSFLQIAATPLPLEVSALTVDVQDQLSLERTLSNLQAPVEVATVAHPIHLVAAPRPATKVRTRDLDPAWVKAATTTRFADMETLRRYQVGQVPPSVDVQVQQSTPRARADKAKVATAATRAT